MQVCQAFSIDPALAHELMMVLKVMRSLVFKAAARHYICGKYRDCIPSTNTCGKTLHSARMITFRAKLQGGILSKSFASAGKLSNRVRTKGKLLGTSRVQAGGNPGVSEKRDPYCSP